MGQVPSSPFCYTLNDQLTCRKKRIVLLVAGRKYPKYGNLTEDDVTLVLISTDKLVDELYRITKLENAEMAICL